MFARKKSTQSRGSVSSTSKSNREHKCREWNLQTPKHTQNKSDLELSRTIMASTFQHHPNQCLCKDCICGRHLCNFNSPIPTLTMATTYKRDYPPRNPYRHRQVPRPSTAYVAESPLLSLKSTYLDQYPQLKGDALSRPKPNDLLKCDRGPSAQLTSYSKEFPGHRGKNQYVPMNPECPRGGLQFTADSTYTKQFGNIRGKSAEKARPPDQFSMTGSWLGGSSYKDQFQNPKNHVSKQKGNRLSQSQCMSRDDESRVSVKNPSSHFKTTYGTQFLGIGKPVCPAVTRILQMQDLSKSKGNFKQNSNFKCMDGRYSSLANQGNHF